MAEDRPLDDAAVALAVLRAEFEDFKSTMIARLPSMPTGTMLPTLATTPPPGTLLLQGQTVSRTTYARLWQWVQDTSAGGFGPGDGSTTFTLPDTRGRVLRGAAAGETVGQAVGSDTRTLTTANLPGHDHGVTVNNHATHSHGGYTSDHNGHGGHHATQVLVAAGGDYGVTTNVSGTNGLHNHTLVMDFNPVSAHVVDQTTVGSGTGVDIRQAGLAVNHLIWT